MTIPNVMLRHHLRESLRAELERQGFNTDGLDFDAHRRSRRRSGLPRG
jgi:hypothetical protein